MSLAVGIAGAGFAVGVGLVAAGATKSLEAVGDAVTSAASTGFLL